MKVSHLLLPFVGNPWVCCAAIIVFIGLSYFLKKAKFLDAQHIALGFLLFILFTLVAVAAGASFALVALVAVAASLALVLAKYNFKKIANFSVEIFSKRFPVSRWVLMLLVGGLLLFACGSRIGSGFRTFQVVFGFDKLQGVGSILAFILAICAGIGIVAIYNGVIDWVIKNSLEGSVDSIDLSKPEFINNYKLRHFRYKNRAATVFADKENMQEIYIKFRLWMHYLKYSDVSADILLDKLQDFLGLDKLQDKDLDKLFQQICNLNNQNNQKECNEFKQKLGLTGANSELKLKLFISIYKKIASNSTYNKANNKANNKAKLDLAIKMQYIINKKISKQMQEKSWFRSVAGAIGMLNASTSNAISTMVGGVLLCIAFFGDLSITGAILIGLGFYLAGALLAATVTRNSLKKFVSEAIANPHKTFVKNWGKWFIVGPVVLAAAANSFWSGYYLLDKLTLINPGFATIFAGFPGYAATLIGVVCFTFSFIAASGLYVVNVSSKVNSIVIAYNKFKQSNNKSDFFSKSEIFKGLFAFCSAAGLGIVYAYRLQVSLLGWFPNINNILLMSLVGVSGVFMFVNFLIGVYYAIGKLNCNIKFFKDTIESSKINDSNVDLSYNRQYKNQGFSEQMDTLWKSSKKETYNS